MIRKTRAYAGIGSRETPDFILRDMKLLAQHLSGDWTLRSGGANGADTAFEEGAIAGDGRKEIFLPWPGFNGRPSTPDYITVPPSRLAEELAAYFHPAWDRCSSTAQKFHRRNSYQVLGQDLVSPVAFVVCWTKGGRRKGGTGQALRIAEHFDIPIFDLAIVSVDDVIAELPTLDPLRNEGVQ